MPRSREVSSDGGTPLDLTQHKKNDVEGKRLHPSNKDVISIFFLKETQMHSGFLITSLDKHVPEFKLQMTGTSPSTYLLWNEKTQIYIFFCIFLLTSVSRAWFNPVDPPNLLFIERRVARATSCPRGAIWQMAPQITMVSHFELQKVWLSIIEVDSW